MKAVYKSLATIVGSLVAVAAFAAQTATLTILHTNDTHGHLMPFSYPGIVPADSAEAQLHVRNDIGGIARRATLVKQIRAELKGKPMWLVDLGDFCDGSPFSTEYHGDADNAAMNATGYDFGIFGNHEYNQKLDQTKKLAADAKRTLVCANAILKETGKPWMKPYVIQKVNGIRVGIFGLITESTATYPAAKEGVKIEGEVATAQKIVTELRQKVDIVVLLSHIGEEDDREVASKVKGIDVILGGHSHTRLPVGELVWWSDELIPNQVNGTIIVQAHQWGGELGRLDLMFDKDKAGKWHVSRYRERLLPITNALQPDPTVAAVLDQFWSPIAAKYSETIGTALGDFSDRGDDMAEYNLVADAIRETIGTDFELENLGGVRSPLVKGKITLADIYTMDPFNNTIFTFELTGKELKAVLIKHQPAVSGIRYRIEYGKIVEATIGGVPIDDEKTYTGSANSYFAGYALKSYKLTDTGKGRLQTVIDYIKKNVDISPRYDGRRVIVE